MHTRMLPISTDLRLKNIPKATISLIVINTYTFFGLFYFPELLFPLKIFPTPDDETFMHILSVISVFLHADELHLIGNMLFLWVFGSYLEDKVGAKRFLFYYFVSQIGTLLVHSLMDGRPLVGASGAISGIMGVYLFRCHYSKVKTIVPIVFVFIKAHINAKWIIPLYFIWDIYDAFNTTDNIAYWAHVGGFLTGFIIGWANRYWIEAKKEHLYEQAIDCIDRKWGLDQAEQNLLELVRTDPEDPQIHLELARHYLRYDDRKEKSKKHYLAAARLQYQRTAEKSKAGSIFLEYLKKIRQPVELETHLKYAMSLSYVCDYSDAAGILKPVIEGKSVKGSVGERVYLHYIDTSAQAGLTDEARSAYEQFLEAYPDSLLVKKAEALLRDGTKGVKEKVRIEWMVVAGRWPVMRQMFDDTTSDPLFWCLILLLISLSDSTAIVLVAPIAFAVTLAVRQLSSLTGGLYFGSSRSESERLREVNVSDFLDKATSCERQENFEDAAEYLEAVLQGDSKNIGARYKLARIYHKNLNQPSKAIREYRVILKTAPEDHPFRRDAYHSIKELSQQAVPSPAMSEA